MSSKPTQQRNKERRKAINKIVTRTKYKTIGDVAEQTEFEKDEIRVTMYHMFKRGDLARRVCLTDPRKYEFVKND